MRVGLVACAVAAVVIGATASASATAGTGSLEAIGPQPTDRVFTKGEVVVRYERSIDSAERSAIQASVGAESATGLELNRAQLINLPADVTVRDAVAELSDDPSVEFAEPNYVYHADAIPNDSFFNQLWGLNNTGQTIATPNRTGAASTFPGTADADIDAPSGWDVAPVENGNASTIVVAVADSGIDYNHPDLAPNMWHNPGEIAGNGIDDDGDTYIDNVFGTDFQATNGRPTSPPTNHPCTSSVLPACTDGNPFDDSDVNHGTHVAGTIGARGNDGYGVTGVAQRVQLMAVKVFDAFDRSSNVSVGNAFQFAGENGAKVVNASLGGACPSALQAAAIQTHPDVLFVFSAGNGGPNGAGDNNDVADDAGAELSPTACGDTANPSANRHPGQYPCNFNAGPEAAGYTGPAYDFPNVMCVAASTNTDARASYSNWGLTSVQIAAPGSQVLSTQPAYQSMQLEDAEEPGFNNRLIDGGGTPITSATTTGWQRVTGFEGSFSLSETAFPGTDYAANTNVVARPAAPVNLTGRTGCHFEWSLNIAVPDSGDSVRIATRIGGTSTFIQGFTGTGTGFSTPSIPELNGVPNGSFELQFVSDADATVGEGARVDGVDLRCEGGNYATPTVGIPMHGTHKFFNGTSMATPHVTGAAALIRAKAPALTPAQVIQRIMDGGDVSPDAAFGLGGTHQVQSGKRLNLPGALNAGAPAIPAAPTITGPTGTTDQTTPTFTLSTDLAGSRFECVLDGTAFGDCTAAASFTPASALADGAHELKVRAIGGEGGVSPTSTQAFTVDTSTPPPGPAGPGASDTAKPTVTITKGPKAKTKKKKATFEFSANEPVSFTCQLDKKPAEPCTSPKQVKAKKGKHTFTVTATDNAGNVGTASQDWKVKKKRKKHGHK